MKLAACSTLLATILAFTGCSDHKSTTPTSGSTNSVAIETKRQTRFEVDENGNLTAYNVNAGESTLEPKRQLIVRVDRDDAPAILGQLNAESVNRLIFVPEFPFEAGIDYVAELTWDAEAATETFRFRIPQADRIPTRLVEVYPTSNRLPENQLKFYLHFSAPMSVGEVYRHVHLIDQNGIEVETPFLELGEELWDGDGLRLTLFIDPGRIKRGLKPREELGPALVAGGTYSLTVDSGWNDSNGQPLAESHSKSFDVIEPDLTQPQAAMWTVASPRAGTTDPLVVTFDEPLDHAMLSRVITVTHEGDEFVGEVSTSQMETKWHFQPNRPWLPGEYSLNIKTILEDLAGNSLGRPFEVNMKNDRETDIPRVIHRSFQISSVQ